MSLAGVVDAAVRYRVWIALAALAVIVAFATGYYLRSRSGRVAVEASWALYQTTFIETSADKTIALEKIVADYGRTQAARFASFELANALYDDGKYEEALKAFRKFHMENSNHLLAPSAIEAVGYCQESLGRWKDAIRTYEDLMRDRPDSPVAARASFRLGHCYEKLEEMGKAIGAYEKVVELAPESLWADYSNQRLALLSPETHPPDTAGLPSPPGFGRPFASPPVPPSAGSGPK